MRQVAEAISQNLAAYGEMYYPFSESVATQSGITTSYSTYTTFLSADTYLNLSYSTTSGEFTVAQNGVYDITFDASVTGPTGSEFDFEIHVNGSEISHGVRLNVGTANDIESGHINAKQRLFANDVVSIHVKSDSGAGRDLGTFNSSFGLTKISI